MKRTVKQQHVSLTDFDRCVEAVSSQKISVKKNGQSEITTAIEAVLQKQFITAIGGSPHAQNQFLRNVQQTAETRRRIVDQEIAYWSEIKRRHQGVYAKYRAEFGQDPEVFPHPLDIQINYETGVTIAGPYNLQEYESMNKTRGTVDAWLLQDALDRARSGRRKRQDFVMGDALSMANLCNLTLPKRLQLSNDEMACRRMDLSHVSIRELLKEARAAWKGVGIHVPRGSYAPSTQMMSGLLKTVAEITRWQAGRQIDNHAMARAVDAAVHKHLG